MKDLKLIDLVMIFIFALILSACGKSDNGPSVNAAVVPSDSEPTAASPKAQVMRVCGSLVLTGLSQPYALTGSFAAPMPDGDYDYNNGCTATVTSGQITSSDAIAPNTCLFSCGNVINVKTCADGHQQLVNWFSHGNYIQFDLDFLNNQLVLAGQECQ